MNKHNTDSNSNSNNDNNDNNDNDNYNKGLPHVRLVQALRGPGLHTAIITIFTIRTTYI